jgi:hypothetical protein
LKINFSPAELAASRVYPVQTSKPKELRYGAVNKALDSMAAEQRNEIRSIPGNLAEMVRLANSGNNSIFDIQKMMLAQFDRAPSIEEITKLFSILEKEGYVRLVKR